MFRLTFDYPYEPGIGQRPSYSEVYDENEEAENHAAQARESGMLDVYCYEMEENECYNHNVATHYPNGY